MLTCPKNPKTKRYPGFGYLVGPSFGFHMKPFEGVPLIQTSRILTADCLLRVMFWRFLVRSHLDLSTNIFSFYQSQLFDLLFLEFSQFLSRLQKHSNHHQTGHPHDFFVEMRGYCVGIIPKKLPPPPNPNRPPCHGPALAPTMVHLWP